MGIFDKKISPEEVRRRLGLVGPGYTAAARRFEAVKARGIAEYDERQVEIVADNGAAVITAVAPPVGVRYVPTNAASAITSTSMSGIEKAIAGLRMGFSDLAAKIGGGVSVVQREVGETVTGLGYGTSLVVGKVGESFGNIQSRFTSIKWWLIIPILFLAFIAVMVSIGYSGVGGPVARAAEREHARVR